MVSYVRTPERTKKGKQEISGKKKGGKEQKRTENETKHALRAQAEPRGDKVVVSWFDQSYDMSS